MLYSKHLIKSAHWFCIDVIIFSNISASSHNLPLFGQINCIWKQDSKIYLDPNSYQGAQGLCTNFGNHFAAVDTDGETTPSNAVPIFSRLERTWLFAARACTSVLILPTNVLNPRSILAAFLFSGSCSHLDCWVAINS